MNRQHEMAVIFDMDGVIFDSERLVVETWVEVAKKYGIEGIEDACAACVGINAQATELKMKEIYGEDFPYQEYKKEASALYHERYDDGRLPTKPGIRELLEFLHANNIRTAVASSTRRAVVEQEIRDAGLAPFFQKIICGDMVERSKPAPDIFLKAAEELGVNPEVCYVIEDSYNGIRGAHTAGMHPIMVPDMLPPTDEMEKLAEQIFPSLFEVRDFIGNKKRLQYPHFLL
ncbi:MAG: HAD family phosphatase [Lachnospiraceae bacterium]|nr:HAD family phosphatase [Lachnospiraceae bacterium]